MNTPDQRLQRTLIALPPVPPSPDLWLRLADSRRRRASRLKACVGTAALLALCVALVPLVGDTGRPFAPSPTVASVPAPAEAGAVLDQDTLERIRALDRALQTAYDEGASDDEIAPLWKARQALLPRHAAASDLNTTGSSKS